MIQKSMKKNIFLLVIFLISQDIFAATNISSIPEEIFNQYIIKYSFINSNSIDALQKNYYNFSLLSKKHNQKTKNFWKKKWQLIMENVCDQHRFERLYFAGIFYHVNDEIKGYFERHLFIYKKLRYLSANQSFISAPKFEWFASLDPNYTMFASNCQMSLLECCIKASYYPVTNKTELCINLIARGAQYDIWMHHGLDKGEEQSLVNDVNTITKESQNPYGPFLLSEYIARHIRCNEQLAEEIVKKGTCAQDIFIKRFPELARYRKAEPIPKPPIPENFINNHHFSEIRYLQLVFKGIFIPYCLNDSISLINESLAYKEVTNRLKECNNFEERLEDIGDTHKIFYYFHNSIENPCIKIILTTIERSNLYQNYNDQKSALIKEFQKKYAFCNRDSENKNAHHYFNKFTKLTTISMNHDTVEWLKKVLRAESKYYDQKNIYLDESMIKGIKELVDSLEKPCIPNNNDSSMNQKSPQKNFNKIQFSTIKKIFLSTLLIGIIILICMKFRNLVTSI